MVVNEITEGLNIILSDLSRHAEATPGFRFRWEKCKLPVDG